MDNGSHRDAVAEARPAGEPVRRRRRVLRTLLLTAGVGICAFIVCFGVLWALTPIPGTTQELATAQGSVIYYRDGKTVLARQGVNRKIVPLSRVPHVVRNAVIAAENRTFYQDQGISLSGMARSVWSTLTGRQLQGGSTITQQMVRNYYSGLSQERSISRKLKEIMIALKVDRSKSKDWILEQYLNTIYYGRGAYGIQAASEAYFAKDVKDLTPAEAAYLAAVIQQPSRFANPTGTDLEAAKARWRAVVNGMVEIGALTREEADRLTFPTLAKRKPSLSLGGQDGYMLALVRSELNRHGYTDEDIDRGNLKIITTFDKRLMRLAREAVEEVLPENTPKKVRTGLAAVDPATGEVVAFYGGRYESYQYDNAFSAKVQAGSTFKPYALAAALEEGYGLATWVNGNSPLRIGSDRIPNAGGKSYGMINLIEATRLSVNTAFVELGRMVGLDKVAAVAEAVGIPAEQLAAQRPYPTFPLGTASVSAVQQAAGYATFAAEGVYHAPHVVRSVVDANGVTRTFSSPGRQVLRKETAADVTYALEQVINSGTGTAARIGRPAAGKTGTTDESAAVWFAGYVPQLSVAVNMFRDDNKPVEIPGYGELYGGTLPAQIWRHFMSAALEGEPVKEFPPPVTWNGHWGSYATTGPREPEATEEPTDAAPTPGAEDSARDAGADRSEPRGETGGDGAGDEGDRPGGEQPAERPGDGRPGEGRPDDGSGDRGPGGRDGGGFDRGDGWPGLDDMEPVPGW